MEKFLYVFNYPPEDKDLCALEFRAMFKPVSYTHLDVYKRQIQQ